MIFMDDDVRAPDGTEAEEEDARRRALLVNFNCLWSEDKEDDGERIVDDIIKSLLSEEEPVEELANRESPHPRIFLMTWVDTHFEEDGGRDFTNSVAREIQMMSFISCKAWFDMDNFDSVVEFLREILKQVAPLPAEEEDVLKVEAEKSTETSLGDDKEDEAMQLTKKLEGFLKGKRFLIILKDVDYGDWNSIRSALLHATAHGSPGSAIVITSPYDDLVESPYKIHKLQNLHALYNKIKEIVVWFCGSEYGIEDILELCHPDVFAMKMFQHLLYVNPERGKTQIDHFRKTLECCRDANKSMGKQMVKISYSDLPAKYRSCLLYLTIFPEGDRIRRTTVCRRWIAEGMITSRENRAQEEADRCIDALLSRGLIQPGEISDTGMVKTFILQRIVREVITRIARDGNFVDTDLPPNLARHLPVHSRTGVQTSHADHSVQAADGNGIVAFLPALAKSSQWQLMKILDLEGCRGIKKQHLKSICKIVLLKYLSLRNTDITELPKQIERLQCLEMLDIRQTVVRAFATKSIMLPMLKHLLAGQAESPRNSSDGSQDLFTAVRLPRGIRRMEQLETLCHVEASHSFSDLTDIGHLLQLRKLGVVLCGNKSGLDVLFQQIEKIHGCLRSLSIQINQPVSKTEDTPRVEEVVTLALPPKLLQSLNISGIRSGLLTWIEKLDQLTKITLSEMYLGEDYIRILGKLTALRCLRLRCNTYAGSRLTFKDKEFKTLKSLVVDDGIITNITFDTGAVPKLENIVWSFATMESISGVGGLPKLKKLELNGDCGPDRVKQVFEELPNSVHFKHKPGHGHQEDGDTIAASTSMSK